METALQVTVLHTEPETFSDELSGLSFLVEGQHFRLLFDVSHHRDIFKNTPKRINLNTDIDFYVVSHGHIDHIDNLRHFRLPTPKPLIMHPMALLPKFLEGESIGFTPEHFSALTQFDVWLRREVFCITPDVVFLGEIQNAHREAVGMTPFGEDILIEDSGLCVRTKQGVSLITGCSHCGIIPMIQKADEVFQVPVSTVIGGLHLFEATPKNVAAIDFLRERNMRVIYGHCFDELHRQKLEALGAQRFRTLDVFQL